MVRLALFGVFVVLLILIVRAILPKKQSSEEQEPTEMVMDPNNGVYIPKSEAIKKTIKGKEYYFSSEQSAEEFIKKQSTP
jgi:YHS domain-containing protein